MAVGLPETITAANGLGPAEVIAWVRETSHEHFARPGIGFDDLWGRWPTLIDWRNAFCEVSKYTRLSHRTYQAYLGGTGDQGDQAT